MNPHPAPAVRRLARLLALTPAVLILAAGTPAFATAPDQWDAAPPVPALHVLLVLVAIPLALAAVISFLVYVPSLARGENHQPGQAWRNEPEWFGGPSDGLETVDTAEPKAVEDQVSGQGGASGRW